MSKDESKTDESKTDESKPKRFVNPKRRVVVAGAGKKNPKRTQSTGR